MNMPARNHHTERRIDWLRRQRVVQILRNHRHGIAKTLIAREQLRREFLMPESVDRLIPQLKERATC